MAKGKRVVRVGGHGKKTARQIAASRRNIKIAQRASAKKRRGTGKPPVRKSIKGRHSPVKPGSRGNAVTRHISRNKGKYGTAIGLAAIAGASYGAYRVYDYQNPRIYHRTSWANAQQIKKTGNWVSQTANRGVEGTKHAIWFSTKRPKSTGPMGYEDQNISKYGSTVVSLRVHRSKLRSFEKSLVPLLTKKGVARNTAILQSRDYVKQLPVNPGYVSVTDRFLKGKKVRVKYLYPGMAREKNRAKNLASFHAGMNPRLGYIMNNFTAPPWSKSFGSGVRRNVHRAIYRQGSKRRAHAQGIRIAKLRREMRTNKKVRSPFATTLVNL